MHLSQKVKFSPRCFIAFLESAENVEQKMLNKKFERHSVSISENIHCKICGYLNA